MSKRSAPPRVEIEVTLKKTTLITTWVRKEDGMVKFFVGDEVKIAYNVSVDDAYTDPATPTVKVLDPSGTKTTYLVGANLVKLDTGKYEFTFTLTLEGEYFVAWEGDAPAVGIAESRIYTRASKAL